MSSLPVKEKFIQIRGGGNLMVRKSHSWALYCCPPLLRSQHLLSPIPFSYQKWSRFSWCTGYSLAFLPQWADFHNAKFSTVITSVQFNSTLRVQGAVPMPSGAHEVLWVYGAQHLQEIFRLNAALQWQDVLSSGLNDTGHHSTQKTDCVVVEKVDCRGQYQRGTYCR